MRKMVVQSEELINGGRVAACFAAGLGLVGIGLSIAATPVTGGSSLALAATIWGVTLSGIGTGMSLGDCIS